MVRASLRSKRFRFVSEQKELLEGDFRFWPREKWNENQTFPLFNLCPFSRGLWLLFLNRTETLATQARWGQEIDPLPNKGL